MNKELVKTKTLQMMKKIIDREIRKNNHPLSTSNCGSFVHQPKRPIKNEGK